MQNEINPSSWDRVRRSQADAAAVIRDLHTQMDREVRHTQWPGHAPADGIDEASYVEQEALVPVGGRA